jgi:glucosylceramidase
MSMSASDEAVLIGSYVGPAFAQANISTKLLAYDHNWDDTAYATTVLSDATAASHIDGTAWHCYSGDVDAQSVVQRAFPDKSIYFTECSGRDWSTDFATHFAWNARNILGAIHNFARTAIMWNLVVDPSRGPHTGGCTDCRGVVTVDVNTDTATFNPEFDVLGQAAKVVQRGAVRVESTWEVGGLQTLAFANPDGTHAIVAYNGSPADQAVAVTGAGPAFTVTLPAGSLASYRW